MELDLARLMREVGRSLLSVKNRMLQLRHLRFPLLKSPLPRFLHLRSPLLRLPLLRLPLLRFLPLPPPHPSLTLHPPLKLTSATTPLRVPCLAFRSRSVSSHPSSTSSFHTCYNLALTRRSCRPPVANASPSTPNPATSALTSSPSPPSPAMPTLQDRNST